MLEKYFVQTFTKMPMKRNAYGDLVNNPAGKQVILYGRMRNYSEGVSFDSPNEESRRDEYMAWFPPSTVLKETDILLYEGAYYEVLRIREARRGMRTNVEFLKVSLYKHAIVS